MNKLMWLVGRRRRKGMPHHGTTSILEDLIIWVLVGHPIHSQPANQSPNLCAAANPVVNQSPCGSGTYSFAYGKTITKKNLLKQMRTTI